VQSRLTPRGARRLLVLLLAFSSPAILLADLLVRRLVGGEDFALLTSLTAPVMTRVAWATLAGVVVVAVPALLIARARPGLDGVVLAACVVQSPALVAGVAGVFGAALLPVALVSAAATLGVLGVGLGTRGRY
jgi:hypothetical protein